MLGHKEEIVKCATFQDVAQFLKRVTVGDASAECVLTNGDLSVLAKQLKVIAKEERTKWLVEVEGAIGAVLLAQEKMERSKTRLIELGHSLQMNLL